MKLNGIQQENEVRLQGLKDFYLPHIFECGQCFRWNLQEDGSYIGVARGKILHIKQLEDEIVLYNSNLDEFNEIWKDYFDLDRDYGKIKEILAIEDDALKSAVEYGWGLRLLKQDIWETIISFIISANRGIAQIKKSIELLCKEYGKSIGIYKGHEYYDFPSPEILLQQSPEDIRQITRVGYRAPYIVGSAEMIANRKVILSSLKDLSTEEARKELLKLPGVGPKVADCILLFSIGKQDAFPVDVWIQRVMKYIYFPEKEISLTQLRSFGEEKFGNLAGFAQQYLFYHARELKIGR